VRAARRAWRRRGWKKSAPAGTRRLFARVRKSRRHGALRAVRYALLWCPTYLMIMRVIVQVLWQFGPSIYCCPSARAVWAAFVRL
jgi:hypothetical protein